LKKFLKVNNYSHTNTPFVIRKEQPKRELKGLDWAVFGLMAFFDISILFLVALSPYYPKAY